MHQGIWQEFDGYEDITAETEACRKYRLDYSLEKTEADPYINRLHPDRLKLRLIDVIEETPSAKTLRLVPPDGCLPPFQAGQYLAVFVEAGNIRTSRPYSISSPPNQTGHYDLTVRRVESGLVSNYLLDEVRRGQVLESSGPAGHFYFNPLFHDRRMVLIAGGSGVTPFMSMIREVTECGLDRHITLFYGSRTLEEAVFHEKLTALASRFDNVAYVPVIENPPQDFEGRTGYISARIIKDVLGDVQDRTFYLCGPQAMYDYCLGQLADLGVPPRKIRREVYGPPLDITLHPGWPEGIKASDAFKIEVAAGKTFQAQAGRTLLAALEQEGFQVPSLCRSGECSQCRIKMLSGKVFQPSGALVRKSDRQYGYVHACVSYPLEDLKIMV